MEETAMVNQLVITLIFLTGIFLLLIFNEMVYRRLGLTGEVTRKFAHFTATLSTLSFPFLFTDHWYVFALAVIFFTLLLFSKKTRHLDSINKIDRVSAGSYLLPVSIYITFLISSLTGDRLLYILPILVLAISDPAAGLLGVNVKRFNHRITIFSLTLHKTWLGSAAFFISSFFISVLVLYYTRLQFDAVTFGVSFAVAVVSTIIEMFSTRGYDNLFIPAGVILVLLVMGN
jgi:phytol kinase